MPLGDRARALLDQSDQALFTAFSALVPRYFRAEVDELIVRIHPLPTLEQRFLTVVRSLVASNASEEACELMTVILRQLGMGAPPSGDGLSSVEGSSSASASAAVDEIRKGRLSGEGLRRMEALLDLRSVLNGRATGRPGWFRKFLTIEAEPADRLLERFSEMAGPEVATLATAARSLDPPGFYELLWLMENGVEELQRDRLSDLRRRDAQHQMLAFQHLDNGLGTTKDYDPSKTVDFLAPPPHKKVERVGVFGAGEDLALRLEDGSPHPRLTYVDTLSAALGVRPFAEVELDTSTMRDPATRQELYQHVMGTGARATGATGDKVWSPRKSAMEEAVHLSNAKGRFFAHEARQRSQRLVKIALWEISEAIRLRQHRATRDREERRREMEAKRQRALAEAEAAALVQKALDLNEKWSAQQKVADQKRLGEKARFAALQTLEVDDVMKPWGVKNHGNKNPGGGGGGLGYTKQRQDNGKSYLLEEWVKAPTTMMNADTSTSGTLTRGENASALVDTSTSASARVGGLETLPLPTTAAAAAVAFGTAEAEDRSDIPSQLALWQRSATKQEKVLQRRERLKESQARKAEIISLSTQMASWRAAASEIDATAEARRAKQEAAHVAFLQDRAALKAAGAKARDRMRRNALAKDEEALRLEQEANARLRREQALEVKARHSMACAEAEQRRVDDFWGLPTAWANWRRREEYKKKVWAARIADRRKRMVQVRNSAMASDAETEAVRNGSGLKEPWQRDWTEGVTI